MPLSKARNRDRMREIRLHKTLSIPQATRPVQPKPPALDIDTTYGLIGIDADGQPIYEC